MFFATTVVLFFYGFIFYSFIDFVSTKAGAALVLADQG